MSSTKSRDDPISLGQQQVFVLRQTLEASIRQSEFKYENEGSIDATKINEAYDKALELIDALPDRIEDQQYERDLRDLAQQDAKLTDELRLRKAEAEKELERLRDIRVKVAKV